jgi:hypothetical protein
MAGELAAATASGVSAVVAIGVAQEFQRVWSAAEGQTSTGNPEVVVLQPGFRSS